MSRFLPAVLIALLGLMSACGGPAETPTADSKVAQGTASAVDTKDVDYTTKLGLMRGHLIAAQELLALRQPQAALPHFGHPIDELYLDIEEQLAEREVADFKTTLIQLRDMVKFSPESPKITTQFQSALAAIDGAMAAVPADRRESSTFVLQVMDGLLAAAAAEYNEAITNGKIAERIEYEDSRGFVLYADSLYKKIATQMAGDDPQTHQTISTNLEQLKKAWPQTKPPATAVVTPEEVTAYVKAIEAASQKVAAL